MKEALHAVITQQLDAFRADDYAAAYGFAAEGIKTMYSVESFEVMVKAGFPAIAHSVSAKCGLTFDDGEQAVVNVRVVGGDDTVADFQYTLQRVGEAWRITGVVPQKKETLEV